ncbi:hypothetical protein SDJN02_09676, partial [Cucurbita argyrosperma subsp. argyrosperma]
MYPSWLNGLGVSTKKKMLSEEELLLLNMELLTISETGLTSDLCIKILNKLTSEHVFHPTENTKKWPKGEMKEVLANMEKNPDKENLKLMNMEREP